MQIPSAGMIEQAQDALKKRDGVAIAKELKELHAAVGERAAGGFAAGYLLGLEVARMMLLESVSLQRSGIDAKDLF